MKKSKSLPTMLGINVLTALYTASVFISASTGERVRPMGWAATIFIITLFSLCLGAFLATVDMMSGKIKLAICGYILSITPFPLALLVFKMVVAVKGLSIAD